MQRPSRPRRGLALAVLVPLLAFSATPLGADAPEDRLRLLGDPEHEEHASALAWWKQREESEQVAILRRALASDDVALAALAAESIGAEFLEASEIRRKMQRLTARPRSLFDLENEGRDWGVGGDRRPWGSPDLVPAFQRIVTDEIGTHAAERLDLVHRVLRTHHVADLVPLLDEVNPRVFRRLLWQIAMCGECDREDRHRAEVARGLLYGLRRLRAERASEPVPPLDDAQVDVTGPPEGGLPESYLTLAGALPRDGKSSLRLDEDGPPSDLEIPFVYPWLQRWALDLTPAAKDLPYLQELVETATEWKDTTCSTALLRWALGHMAQMPGEDGMAQVEAWAKDDDSRAVYAAAALAEQGAQRRFNTLFQAITGQSSSSDKALRYLVEDLLWTVDRSLARERWVRRVLGDALLVLGADRGLDAPGRHERSLHDGIETTAEDLAWIANALWERGAAAMTLAWFYGTVCPEGLTKARAAALLERLSTLDPLAWESNSPVDALPLLAMIEVRDRDGLVALLHGWFKSQEPIRSEVLQWLARLGDASHAAAMIEDWEDWNSFDQWILGRVKDETVHDFLVTQVKSEEVAYAVPAMQALLVQAGLPDPLVRCFNHFLYGDEPEAEVLSAVRRMVLAGDFVGALLHVEGGDEFHLLGLLDDDRAREFLRRFQVERHHAQFRDATVGLAIGGDDVALRELRSFLDDDRTWMIEGLPEGFAALLPAPWMVEHWVERLDSNCCLGWVSMVRLREIYPTIPFEDGWGGAGTRHTRAWIASYDWKRSRLLDGLVPVAR